MSVFRWKEAEARTVLICGARISGVVSEYSGKARHADGILGSRAITIRSADDSRPLGPSNRPRRRVGDARAGQGRRRAGGRRRSGDGRARAQRQGTDRHDRAGRAGGEGPARGAMPYDTLIQGGRVVLPGPGVQEADLAIESDRIAAVLGAGTGAQAHITIDARGLHVLPGAVDPHTHWGYRGDFGVQCESDSRAAAIGGTTTALLFHRIQPGQFPELRQLGEARSTVDFVFSPAIFSEATAGPMEEAITAWGCPSFKFYLAYRRLPGAPPGDDWNELTDGLMLEVLERMARWDGTLACVHAENAEVNNRAIARVRMRGTDGLAAWEEANPGIAEAEAVLRAGLYAERTRVPVYFVHLSGRDALAALRRVRVHWPRTYGETCPHYLFHNVESSPPSVKF